MLWNVPILTYISYFKCWDHSSGLSGGYFEEILYRRKKNLDIHFSHNSAPQYHAEETQAFSVQFRGSSIYLVSCSSSLLECSAACVNFHTRLHLELHKSDIIFNYITGKWLSSETLLEGLQSVSKDRNRCNSRNELHWLTSLLNPLSSVWSQWLEVMQNSAYDFGYFGTTFCCVL